MALDVDASSGWFGGPATQGQTRAMSGAQRFVEPVYGRALAGYAVASRMGVARAQDGIVFATLVSTARVRDNKENKKMNSVRR